MRKRQDRAYWERLVAAYRSSGLTQSAFARKHGVSATSIHRWHHRLGDGATGFVEAVVEDGHAAVEVTTTDGVTVRFGAAVDARFVAEVARALTSGPC